MELFINKLGEKLSPVMNKLATSNTLLLIRDSLSVMTPILMIGSVFTLIVGFPNAGYQTMLRGVWDGGLIELLKYPVRFSYEIAALYCVISFAFQISKQKDQDAMPLIIIALLSYLVLTYKGSFEVFSARNMLLAALISIAVSNLHITIKNRIKETQDSLIPPAVVMSLKNLLPYLTIAMVVVGVRGIFEYLNIDLIHLFSTTILAFLETILFNYWGMLLIVFLIQLFWFFGSHGSRFVFSAFDLLLVPAMEINRLAFMNHEPLPNIISKQFFDIFVSAGGTPVFGLILALLLVGRKTQLHAVGKDTIWPATFNISEPIVFSLPIVANKDVFIPYILAPLVCGSLTYFAMANHYVRPTLGVTIPWFIPSFIAGYLATLDVNAIIMQGINIVVAMLIYMPFVLKMRKDYA